MFLSWCSIAVQSFIWNKFVFQKLWRWAQCDPPQDLGALKSPGLIGLSPCISVRPVLFAKFEVKVIANRHTKHSWKFHEVCPSASQEIVFERSLTPVPRKASLTSKMYFFLPTTRSEQIFVACQILSVCMYFSSQYVYEQLKWLWRSILLNSVETNIVLTLSRRISNSPFFDFISMGSSLKIFYWILSWTELD